MFIRSVITVHIHQVYELLGQNDFQHFTRPFNIIILCTTTVGNCRTAVWISTVEDRKLDRQYILQLFCLHSSYFIIIKIQRFDNIFFSESHLFIIWIYWTPKFLFTLGMYVIFSWISICEKMKNKIIVHEFHVMLIFFYCTYWYYLYN